MRVSVPNQIKNPMRCLWVFAGVFRSAPVCLILVLISLMQFGTASAAVIINEVMFNPDGDEYSREYIEILNTGPSAVSLENWAIGDGEGFDTILSADSVALSLEPGQYGVVFDPDYFTAGELYATVPDSTLMLTVAGAALGSGGLSNSSTERVSLINADGDTVSAVTYSLDCEAGYSWERILPGGDDSHSNFAMSDSKDGTPGRENSITPPLFNPALDDSSLIQASANPAGGGSVTLSVNYVNAGRFPLNEVRILITSETGDFSESIIFASETLPQKRPHSSDVTFFGIPAGIIKFTAAIQQPPQENDAADDTTSLEVYVPVAHGGLLINEVMAAPDSGKPEWVEILSMLDHPVNLRGFHIGDSSGGRSSPVMDDIMLAAGGYAVFSEQQVLSAASDAVTAVVGNFPSLNNDTDSVLLIDSASATVDSMAYFDTDQGVSLELIAPEYAGATDGWDYSVDESGATPGARNSIYFSNVADNEATASNSVEITVSPNPFTDTAEISYSLPFAIARVRINLYDRRGRHITTILDEHESGSTWASTWNAAREHLALGPYIMLFEAIDKRTGRSVRKKMVVVCAEQL